jgi:hypothetical protein
MKNSTGTAMVPVELVKTMRKKADHATRISLDISECIAWISPEIAAHTSRYLEAQAEEMRNILIGLAIAECETPLRDSAMRLVSKYSDLAMQTTREVDVRRGLAASPDPYA